ncbi:Peptidase M19 renal dipeptidase [Penicillium cosmopolitanum]|uniref:Dipeptidase n=1 Tax=Penicillium cosmopolitanum TaxID=1131564 RepID=A0A9W9VT68_9EURO|nr:Peptidase M19 renal dipeptidase [Penicillium cosmopolitanum]KAJ5388883.1 Peptidase M19 renal dipeptidase [Penicillium cosmopolitanum]
MPIDEKDKVQAKTTPAHSSESAPRAVLQHKSSTRNWLFFLLVLVGAGWFLGPRCSHRMLRTPATLQDRVHNILTNTPLIDGHDDFPILIRERYHNHIYGSNFTESFIHGNLSGHVDLPRLRRGYVGGTFWSVFVPCPADGTDFSDENYAPSVRQTVEQVDLMARVQKAFPEIFSRPPNGTTALQAFQEGKIISPLGIEGLQSIGNSLAHLRMFYDMGVSYATLTHNCHNKYADAALVELPGGGIKKADPIWHGMIIDLAHVSVQTMRDVLGAGKSEWPGSRAPVIFSHSSAHALCPHPRNVPDDVLALVQKTKSIVMVNFAPDFISCTASDNENGLPDTDLEHATLERVADHIVHIGTVAGFDYVGLGSDFDGIPTTPQGLEDVSKFPNLIAELLRRGVSDEDAGKVAGGNLLRVWRQVDQVALEMQARGDHPAED